ncbi:hypothetical protein DBZ36_04000 [Alginatibacterium sediminis]|uniref:Flagellar protein FliT n=1 Tax=Alginatibacterium sediminis TaxID=2164068 RepID=A0A420EG40_9ALTE|nr:hypothetical protein [Alginatibacterium sediminis]RKF19638.1 hypothetical protein DBZ36_04000 [Alginatibacterium sediminis]
MLSDSADLDKVTRIASAEKILSEISQLLEVDAPDLEHLNALLLSHFTIIEELFETHNPASDEHFASLMRDHSAKLAVVLEHCAEQHHLLGQKLGSLNRGRKVLNKYNQNA